MRIRSILGKVLIAASLAIFVILWGWMVMDAFQSDGKPLNTLDPQGPSSTLIDNLAMPVFAVAAVVFVAVLGVVLFVAIRFREKEGEEDLLPKQLHGATKWEIGWTALPAIILAVVAVATVNTLIDLNETKDDALKVEVFGQQWWWGFRYDMNDNGTFDDPEDIETSTELVVPTGRQIDLDITSNDVIHSFWIPGLNGKKDAVPGMVTDWTLEADKVGVYRGQCTEFCGLSHANMRMLVRSVDPADFDTWAQGQTQPAAEPPASNALAVEGKAQWESLCAGCHLIDGVNNQQLAETPPALVSGIAPNLTHLMSRGTFAGSIYNLHYPNPGDGMTPNGGTQPFGATCDNSEGSPCGEPTDVALPGNPDNPVYTPYLEAWLRNAPAMKPMAPDSGRGMPNLGLTEDQIDQIVAYLETLQ